MLFYILFLVIKIYIRNSVFKKTNNNLEGLRHLTDVAYQVWLPLITLFLAIKTDGRWILILPFHILFLLPSYLHEKMTDGIRFIYGKLLVYVFIPGRHYSSRVINYTIYYFFLLFGVNLKKENKSAMKYLKSRLEKQ